MEDVITMYDYLNKQMMDPFVLTVIGTVVLCFLIISISLGSGSSSSPYGTFTIKDNNAMSGNVLMPLFIFILFAIVLANVLYFVYKIDVVDYIQKWFHKEEEKKEEEKKEEKDASVPAPLLRPIQPKKQVFNIPGNYYSYEDAKAVCAAFDSKLATYDQIEKAYNKGAEWCNYGWSSDQLALFPTQKKTFELLQSKPGRGNDCGRPGVNGGYIANPNVKFGVNCYGVKPRIKPEEEHIMQTIPPFPQTAEEIEFQKKVDNMKKNINAILVSPFNHESWEM